MRVRITDLQQLPATSREITSEGYLRAGARITRTGVFLYRAGEFGLQGADADKPIKLYRPDAEVFSPATIASFEGCTVTEDHPAGGVTSHNWRSVSVGDVAHVRPDGEYLAADILVKDSSAIRAVLSGKCLLSAGCNFEIDWTPGQAPDGAEYDGVAINIVGNHVAIVDSGRAGSEVRIRDHRITGDTMKSKKKTKKTITDGARVVPLVGRAKAIAAHAANAAQKSAAAAAGLKGRAAFLASHKHIGGSK